MGSLSSLPFNRKCWPLPLQKQRAKIWKLIGSAKLSTGTGLPAEYVHIRESTGYLSWTQSPSQPSPSSHPSPGPNTNEGTGGGAGAGFPLPGPWEPSLNGGSGIALGFAAHTQPQYQPHQAGPITLLGSKRKEYINTALLLWNHQFPNSGMHQNSLRMYLKHRRQVLLAPEMGFSRTVRNQESLHPWIIMHTQIWEHWTKFVLIFN